MMADDSEDEVVNPEAVDDLLEAETDDADELGSGGVQFDEFGAPEEE